VEVGVLTIELERLVPDQRVGTKVRCPVVLDKYTLALFVNQSERVD
jgi:hypothetical protein